MITETRGGWPGSSPHQRVRVTQTREQQACLVLEYGKNLEVALLSRPHAERRAEPAHLCVGGCGVYAGDVVAPHVHRHPPNHPIVVDNFDGHRGESRPTTHPRISTAAASAMLPLIG